MTPKNKIIGFLWRSFSRTEKKNKTFFKYFHLIFYFIKLHRNNMVMDNFQCKKMFWWKKNSVLLTIMCTLKVCTNFVKLFDYNVFFKKFFFFFNILVYLYCSNSYRRRLTLLAIDNCFWCSIISLLYWEVSYASHTVSMVSYEHTSCDGTMANSWMKKSAGLWFLGQLTPSLKRNGSNTKRMLFNCKHSQIIYQYKKKNKHCRFTMKKSTRWEVIPSPTNIACPLFTLITTLFFYLIVFTRVVYILD